MIHARAGPGKNIKNAAGGISKSEKVPGTH